MTKFIGMTTKKSVSKKYKFEKIVSMKKYKKFKQKPKIAYFVSRFPFLYQKARRLKIQTNLQTKIEVCI